jgi:putative ABC transport system permease protein
MIKNYFSLAWRTMRKQKFFASINILGLAIGLACCLLIFVYVENELSYDRFHRQPEQIYRVSLTGKISGQEILTSASCMPLADAMQTSIPGVEQVLRVIPATRGSGITFRFEDLSFAEEKVFYVDSNFFQFFSFPLIEGDPATALREPNSIVITETIARKYFGNEPALGKTLVVRNDKKACKVTAIARDVPSNSHLRFHALISMITVEREFFPGWTGNSIQTYIRKEPATTVASIDNKLADLVTMHVGKELEQGLGISFEEFRKQGGEYSYRVYPLLDSHLRGLPDDYEPGGDIRYVYIFSGVGIFILLIACVNFMNLATARSAGRAKEVGLRKTLGSQRAQLIGQFLSESLLYCVLAMLLALGLAVLALPQFNLMAGKELTLAALGTPSFLAAVLLLVVVVAIVSGSYPAFYLTSFQVVDVLKGKLRAGFKSSGVRSAMVVFQFFISTLLIIATLVVYQQLRFMQSKNLGLDKNQVLVVQGTGRLQNNIRSFKAAIEQEPGVVKSSFSNNEFPGVDNITVFRTKGSETDHLMGQYVADWDHQEVLKLKLAEGRFFSRDFGTDTLAVVLNRAAVKELGLTDPLNRELQYYGGDEPRMYRIVGVLEDFNFESLRAGVRPLVIMLAPDARRLYARYEGDPQRVIMAIERHWKTMAAGEPLEYVFLDSKFDALFRSEMRLRSLFATFTLLAIFIACLGLFALAAFSTEQRTKEIGVRKAMGASVPGLTLMLSNEFTKLVLIAVVPAVAVGWWAADWWLADFEYRVTLTPWLFIGSSLFALVVAWLTVSTQSVRAAWSDPVKSLRYE